MSARIIHSADLHIGSAFEGLPPEKAASRKEGQLAVLEEIISLSEKNRVQAILLSGDLFDRPAVSPDLIARVTGILAKTGIPVFIAPGNHDYFHTRSPYSIGSWPENVHIFRSPVIERVELKDLVVYGAGFTDSNVYRPLISGFHTVPAITGGLQVKPSVMALHGELNPSEPRYNPVSVSDIASSGLDYLALGHVHMRSDPQRIGSTVYAYCGCPEGRGFDETGQKGCYLAEFDGGVKVRFLPLSGVKYSALSVDVTGHDDPVSAIISSLPYNSVNEIFRITLKGEFPPHNLHISEISERIAPYVYHAMIHDHTSLPRSIWEQAGDDTLSGLFLSMLRERLSDEHISGETRELIELAARYGLAALNGEEAPLL